ncbi:Protein virilizer-like protein, partial [Dinothrombium tinctorium]
MEKEYESGEQKCDQLPDLVFFDTFAHETHEFTRPVFIDHITVIPLGTKIEADFPGGVRLGATNPSSFALQFYINDLTKPNVSTFSYFGSIDYKQNVCKEFSPSEKKPTDGLLIRGCYSTLTLAIFGEVTDLSSIIPQSETPSTTPVLEPNSSFSLPSNVPFDSVISAEEKAVFGKSEDFDSLISRREKHVVEESDLVTVNQADFVNQSETKKSPETFIKSKETFLFTERNHEKERTHSEEKKKVHTSPPYGRRKSKSPISYSKIRSRSGSNSPEHPKRRSSRSPYRKRRTPSPYSKRRSPHSSRSSPKSVRSRSPRSIQSLSPSPKYSGRTGSPSSRSQKSSRSLKSTSSTSHSPPLRRSNENLSHKDDKQYEKQEKDAKHEDGEKQSVSLALDTDMLEPVSSEHSPVSAENVSDNEDLGDIDMESGNDNLGAVKDNDDFEAISSDEEYIDDGPIEESDVLIEYGDYHQMNDYSYIWTFNPFQCEFFPLNYFHDPSSSIFNKRQDNINQKKLSEVLSLIDSFKSEITKNEKWIEAVEVVAESIHILSLDNNVELVQCLIDWVIEGLDYDLAIRQPLTGYKVRHMKAGIKLLIALLDVNDDIVNALLSTEAVRMLLDLFFKPYMSLPVKLLITRGLDAVCNTAAGIQHITTYRHTFENTKDGSKKTCYQVLLNLVLSKPSTRLSAALIALLKKIHFYECIELLKKIIEEHKTTYELEFAKLRSLLIEITTTFRKAKQSLSQRVRYLPVSSQFQVSEVSNSIYFAIYRWMKHHDTINCLIQLYQDPDLDNLVEYCDEFVAEILNGEHGPLFFLGKEMVNKTNVLQRIMMQHCDENENQNNIGLRLSFILQAYYLIDSLFAIQKQENFDISRSCDDPETTSTIHRLYALVFNNSGRRAVIESLSTSDNLRVLLPFLTPTGNDKIDSKLFKSCCTGYAVELCLLTVHSCEDRIINFIENHAENLLKLANNEYLPKLHVLSSWLSPLKNDLKISYSEHTFKSLVEIIKKYSENVTEVNDNGYFIISPELITVVRILKQLCVKPLKEEKYDFGCSIELKYQYGIIQLYTLDSLSLFINIMNKLLDTYLKPSHQSPALVGYQGSLVIFFIHPTLKIIKEILYQLTTAQGKDFKDVSPIPVFLRTYSLMSIFPSSSVHYSLSQEICSIIIEILMIYTQICLSATETEEAFIKSVWTKMVHEVFQYTFSQPLTFIHGLTLLSELLPLPLPLRVPEPLNSDEILKLVNFRKLWSAHLHVLNSDIETMITNFIFSSSQYIQQLLRRICIRISDLTASSAVTIVKCVLELFLEHFPSEGQITSQFYSVLNLLSSLLTHPPFKITVIQVIYGIKCEEKYGQILNKLLNLLRINSDKLSSISTMETLLLSNSIPPKEALVLVSNTLISQTSLDINGNNVSLISLCLRTMSMLCEHDVGFWTIKQGLLEKYPNALHTLITNLSNLLENDPSKSDYYKQALHHCIEFFKLLLNADENEDTVCQRKLKLSNAEMRKLLKLDSEGELDNKPNLLSIVQRTLKSMESDEEKLINLIDWLLLHLDSKINESGTQNVPQEPILPSPESLTALFSGRQIFYVTNHFTGERHYFPLSSEFFDYDPSLIGDTKKINLLALSEKYCGPDFNLKTTLEELCKCQEPGELPLSVTSEATTTKKRYEPLITQKDSMPFTTSKIPFVAPMRGRGFARQGMIMHSSRANDPFRSRPPNTSRPPSMHVDDFVALEQGRGDLSASFLPTGMKRQSKDYKSCSPTPRGFNPSSVARSGYYPDMYPIRRQHQISPPPMHQSRSRYMREYSPHGSRS